MKSDIDRIKFALRLMELELNALNERDWEKLLREVRNFLKGMSPAEDAREIHEIDFFSWKEKGVSPVLLASVQGSIRYALTSVTAENWRIDHGSFPPWGSGSTTVPAEVSVSADVDPSTRTVKDFPWEVPIKEGGCVRFNLLLGGFRPYLIDSSVSEAFLFGLGVSLSRVNASYLRRCPACAKIFFADHGRQEHCSSRCAGKERKRRLRAVAKQRDMKQKFKKGQRGKKEHGAPKPPSLVPDTGPFKRPRKKTVIIK